TQPVQNKPSQQPEGGAKSSQSPPRQGPGNNDNTNANINADEGMNPTLEECERQQLLCGVSHMIMVRPMKAPNGKYYDYQNIMVYLGHSNSKAPDGSPLEMKDLKPDVEKADQIQIFAMDHPNHPLIPKDYNEQLTRLGLQG
ncbi:MAG: hypothetical protein EZS28_023112, partial [Streblomastix strix]